ncbi:ABC transporter permease [Mycoplasma feriruminatoris]|uniref:Oligopeptide transport system permease protein OppB n=1 Tax=Mycoplasma feriruminatoris TaxID=1179777 RepID=A0A654IQB3_9MOLU|nr:ABC transporter permease [Mycoplasma feriruminatoris]WFQ94696.1 Oligopeptide transport system permease protein OppB [Mycoplasma feriruminatoris]VZS00820.1 Oligopeptide transport system permease protein OppB [Mycoplasma feriruminatoris]VZS00957.1 Oligopeptide transport system permease protein OppB [Mycoplasma feriruminatoris]
MKSKTTSNFVNDLSTLPKNAIEHKQYVDFSNKIKYQVAWHKRIFNIKTPWISSLLRTIWVFVEFLIVAFIVITATFFLINLVPGGTGLTAGLDEAAKAAVEEHYGLNQPLLVRYGIYLYNILHLDFGISLSVFPGEKINDFVWVRFYKSFLIGIFSVMLTLLIGIPLGVYVGMNPDKLPDHIATVLVSIFSSIPSLVFALWLLLLGRSANIPYIFDQANLASYILPGFSLSLGSIIVYIKYIRTELNRELNSQHCKFIYLKGISKRRFVWTHALKPALFPIATFFPVVIFGSFIGSLFIEQIFFITGSGGLLLNAITSKDFNIILFMVTLFSLLTILSYTCRDALYKVIDPRVRKRA